MKNMNISTIIKRGVTVFLAALVVMAAVPIGTVTVQASAPNFSNTVFRAEPGVRVNIRSNLNGNHDGWFSYDSGDVRIISAGHFRSGVEYFRVRYPLFAGGHREGFARRSDILIGNRQPSQITFRQNTNVMRNSAMRTNFGTAWGGNRGAGYAWQVGARGNNLQVIYRLDAGGHRLGWVPASSINSAVVTGTNALTSNATIRFPLRGAMTRSSNAVIPGTNVNCDFVASRGTQVFAPGNGSVSFHQAFTNINNVRTLTSFGNHIRWTSSCGQYTMLLAHLDSFQGVSLQIPSTQTRQQSGSAGTLNLGTRQVRQGDLLGTTGSTGFSSDPHLHLELRHNGRVIVPSTVLRTWN